MTSHNRTHLVRETRAVVSRNRLMIYSISHRQLAHLLRLQPHKLNRKTIVRQTVCLKYLPQMRHKEVVRLARPRQTPWLTSSLRVTSHWQRPMPTCRRTISSPCSQASTTMGLQRAAHSKRLSLISSRLSRSSQGTIHSLSLWVVVVVANSHLRLMPLAQYSSLLQVVASLRIPSETSQWEPSPWVAWEAWEA